MGIRLVVESESRAVLQTRMGPAVARLLPQLEGYRRWLKDGNLRVDPTPYNLEVLQGGIEGLEIVRQDTATADHTALAFDTSELDYKPKTEPYPHQVAALAKIRELTHFALFMEQGTGKSKVIIDRAGELWAGGRLTGVLVLTKKGVHRQWITHHIPSHYGAEWYGLHWPIKLPEAGVLPKELLRGRFLKWFTMNIDGPKTKKGWEAAAAFCKEHVGSLLIVVDESQDIKNKESARWSKAEDLGKLASFRAISTGTPIAKDLLDEWAQLSWLDHGILGIKFKRTFLNEYCIMGGYDMRQVVAHRNVDRFKERTDPHIFRVRKEELGLMPKAFEPWEFDLTAGQRKIIKELKKNLLAEIAQGNIAPKHAADACLKMQQVASGFARTDDGELHLLDDNPRLDAMMDWRETVQGKRIIWCRFQADIELVADKIGDAAVTYYGPMNSRKRDEALRTFIEDPSITDFVATPQAAGTGLDGLQAVCNAALYYSHGDNSIARWQSEDRIHRIGTHGIVTYTDMVGRGSTDLKILRNQDKKKSLADMVLDDIVEWLTEDEPEFDSLHDMSAFEEMLNETV